MDRGRDGRGGVEDGREGGREGGREDEYRDIRPGRKRQ